MEMGRTSAVGSFHLFFGKSISTVIMAIGTIIMGAIILDGDYGLFTIAMIPATTLLLFQDWGVSSAVTRECAQCRAVNNGKNLRKIIISSISFELTTGIVLTLISLLTANFMATAIFGKPDAVFLVAFASINILSTSVFTITHSILIGFEKMKLISIVLVCQGIVQCVLGPALVFLGFGAFGALLGFITASVVASVISILIVYLFIFRKLDKVNVSRSDIIGTLKALLKYGIPLAIGVIISGLLLQFSSFMMALYVKDLALIGNYKVATNFGLLIGFFSSPIITVLFPAFSKLNPEAEPDVTKSVFTSSIKYSALLIVPATLAMIVLSNPLIGTLYGVKWPVAPLFLILSIAGNLYALFGNLSVANFLSALGHTKFLMSLNLISLAIGIPLTFVLISRMGISGMLISPLISGVPSLFLGLRFLWKKYGVKIDYKVSASVFFSSALAAAAAYVFTTLPVVYLLKLVVGLALFLAVYLISAPMVGAINNTDITFLKVMFKDLGVASKIIEIPFRVMEKVLLHFHGKKA
jgi:O-antigen/teichoic acid export membrane protein